MFARRSLWAFIGVGLVLCVILAGVVSHYASSSPDGLIKVAGDAGFLDAAKGSATAGSPLSGYGVVGLSDPRPSRGLAGLGGVTATGLITFGLFHLLARRKVEQVPPAANA